MDFSPCRCRRPVAYVASHIGYELGRPFFFSHSCLIPGLMELASVGVQWVGTCSAAAYCTGDWEFGRGADCQCCGLSWWVLLRVLSAVYDCAHSLSPALWILHGRPGCSGSIDLPISYSSLSLLADDEAYAYHHGDGSSTSLSASLRPKGSIFRAWLR